MSNQQDIPLLRKRVEKLRRKAELMKSFGLLFYRPHPKQERFHAHADFRFRLGRCGNRFGKSDMGVSEDLAFALGERPWYPEGHPLRTLGIPQHPTKGIVLAADDDKIDEIFTGNGSKGHVGKIWKKIPKDLIVGTKRSSSGTIVNMRIKGKYGESVIDFDTRSAFKTNPMGAESSDYDWAHIDEPIEEAHWKAILRGLTDRGGKAWFTCTLIEQPWIDDMFFPDVEHQTQDEYAYVSETGRKVKWAFTGSIYDNIYLTPEDIEDFHDSLTEEERECRIHGRPLRLAGLIYKEFDPKIHILKEVPKGWTHYENPPRDYTIHVAVDTHPRTPNAVLFIAVSPKGEAFVYDEIFQSCDTKELATLIKERLAGRNVLSRILEPAAFIVDQHTKTCISDELAKHGAGFFDKGSKDVSRGIAVVKQMLKEPNRIRVSPNCKTFRWEINRYAWDNKKGVPLNKPVDKDDHIMENFRRLCVNGLFYLDFTNASAPVSEAPIDFPSDLNDVVSSSLEL